jgi:hypothetical protein
LCYFLANKLSIFCLFREILWEAEVKGYGLIYFKAVQHLGFGKVVAGYF